MNQITVLAFGAVAEALSKSRLELDNITSTGALKQKLEAGFPALRQIRYAVAVNKNIVTADTLLEPGATVALLPPFSGG